MRLCQRRHRGPLAVLSVMLRTAVDWGVIERVPCSIKMLPTTKSAASFYDFEEYERLVEAARGDLQTRLVVLLGGEAGMRCGEIMALEWTDVDLNKRQLCVARSEWKGHVTVPKGGRLRYVPLTKRLTEALRQARHLRGAESSATSRATAHAEGGSGDDAASRSARERQAGRSHPVAHVLFAPGDAWRAGKGDSGARRTSGLGHHSALHALEPGRDRCGDSVVGDGHRNESRGSGEIVEAAGTEGPKAHIH